MRLWIVLALAIAVPARGEERLSDVSPMDVPTQLAGLSTEEFTELVNRTQRSVVVVTFAGREGTQLGLGSGFIISDDGLIATNLHVIGEGRPISVRLHDGTRYDVQEVHATNKSQDLAVLKIEAEKLPALEIAAADQLRQGQPVFALGNPQGLNHSVVAGVVSGFRDLEDGMKLIQLAIPIERGNSGGPLLDMQGRVHGLLTLKSQVTENLGYAVKVNAITEMLETPHPIPISRWLTIGALNPRLWEFSKEVHWHQRAGRILVDGQAHGFGGRSLCLFKQELPEAPFEVGVDVLVNEDDGAAGLVFHSDGSDRHFGYYPSSGSLRVSRFDGPTVYSWNVLQEAKTPAFRPKEWNRLKVRIEADGFRCYCNDQLVFTSSDTTYSSGRVGLAKFRHTTAEFKRFTVAQEIPSERPDPELLSRIDEITSELTAEIPPSLAMIEEHKDFAIVGQRALRSAADELEQKAKRLRQLAEEIHAKRVQDALLKGLEEGQLFEAAMQLAVLDNPDLSISDYGQLLEQMAGEIQAQFSEEMSDEERLEAFHEYFFEEQNYHGNQTQYYDYSNSYLNEVIDDREGLPITLTVLYVELARRIGLQAEGIGLPGHFIARVSLDGDDRLIDVFERGERLTEKECRQRVQEFTGLRWDPSYLEPQDTTTIVERMLRNLIRVANDRRDPEAALRYTRTILAIRPDSADDKLFKAVLCYSTNRVEEGLAQVDWLLEEQPAGIVLARVEQLRDALLELASGRE